MTKEMRSLEDFDTNEDVDISTLDPYTVQQSMTLLWVHIWRGFVKSRLCVRGYEQSVASLDDTYASTPVIYVLRILLIIALSRNWMIHFFDISTAFLHAPLSSEDPICVWPPGEFYPTRNILWRLKKEAVQLQNNGKHTGLLFYCPLAFYVYNLTPMSTCIQSSLSTFLHMWTI